jgi:hypothetical protein
MGSTHGECFFLREVKSELNPKDGHGQVRFAFCKKLETLREAAKRLAA